MNKWLNPQLEALSRASAALTILPPLNLRWIRWLWARRPAISTTTPTKWSMHLSKLISRAQLSESANNRFKNLPCSSKMTKRRRRARSSSEDTYHVQAVKVISPNFPAPAICFCQRASFINCLERRKFRLMIRRGRSKVKWKRLKRKSRLSINRRSMMRRWLGRMSFCIHLPLPTQPRKLSWSSPIRLSSLCSWSISAWSVQAPMTRSISSRPPLSAKLR